MALLAAFKPLYAFSGFMVGLLVGQTGMGGGSLMTPVLVLLFGVHPAAAVGTDLLYAAATKSVGTLVHGANRSVNWRITGLLALGSLPMSALTLYALSKGALMGPAEARMISHILGVMLVLTAISLLARRLILSRMARVTDGLTVRQISLLTVVTGAILGVLVTISSVGAGALGVVALLVLYPRLRMATIVGSDVAHAVPLTLLAGVGHWWLGSVDVGLLMSLLIGSIPGVILGSQIAQRVPDRVLRPILAATLAIVGGLLVV